MANTLTARPAYAYSPRQTAWSYANYHAVLDQPLDAGRLHRKAGDALCKPAQRFWGLERITTSPVDCPRCIELAERHGVTLIDPTNKES